MPDWAIQLLLIAAVSLPACGLLVFLRRARGGFLPYEPRWPVPWGAMGSVLAVALAVLSIMALIEGQGPADVVASRAATTSDEFVKLGFLDSALKIGLVALIGGVLVSSAGAKRIDLGLPSDARELSGDAALGALAGLAVMLPTFALQVVLVYGIGFQSQHPTLYRLATDPNPWVMIVAVLTAGLAAPVFEEVTFRLLLQGWLERVEDESLSLANRMKFDDQASDPAQQTRDEPALLEEAIDSENDRVASLPESIRKLHSRKGSPPIPPAETAPGLPHGWAPILVSSFIFCLVHITQGAAVVSLFPLAVMFGYLYQRTHRLVPSIAAHATFNLSSLAIQYFLVRWG